MVDTTFINWRAQQTAYKYKHKWPIWAKRGLNFTIKGSKALFLYPIITSTSWTQDVRIKRFPGIVVEWKICNNTPPPCIGAPATFTSEPSKKFKFDIQAKCLFRTLHWPPAYLNHGLVKAAAQLWQGRWRWRFFAAIFRHFPTHHLLALLPSFSSCTAWFIVDGVHMVEHGPRANLNHSSFNSTHGTTLPDKKG